MTSLTVDVWGPVVETRTADVVKSTTLRTDDRPDRLNQRIVEGSAREDGLGEGRRITEIAGSGEVDPRT